MKESKLKIIEIAYHRNGVCGEPFSVVLFKDGKRKMMATLFDGEGRCAVFDTDLLAKGNIKFGENSWRGDHYIDELRAVIKADEEAKYKKFFENKK